MVLSNSRWAKSAASLYGQRIIFGRFSLVFPPLRGGNIKLKRLVLRRTPHPNPPLAGSFPPLQGGIKGGEVGA